MAKTDQLYRKDRAKTIPKTTLPETTLPKTTLQPAGSSVQPITKQLSFWLENVHDACAIKANVGDDILLLLEDSTVLVAIELCGVIGNVPPKISKTIKRLLVKNVEYQGAITEMRTIKRGIKVKVSLSIG